jgi:hypothetical protein
VAPTEGAAQRGVLVKSMASCCFGELDGIVVAVWFGLDEQKSVSEAHCLTPARGTMSSPEDERPMKSRDLMAPDTEPTDEELAVVMRGARDRAIQRRARGEAWIAARLEEAARFAREHGRPRKHDEPGER